jgi:hypothetical protein
LAGAYQTYYARVTPAKLPVFTLFLGSKVIFPVPYFYYINNTRDDNSTSQAAEVASKQKTEAQLARQQKKREQERARRNEKQQLIQQAIERGDPPPDFSKPSPAPKIPDAALSNASKAMSEGIKCIYPAFAPG